MKSKTVLYLFLLIVGQALFWACSDKGSKVDPFLTIDEKTVNMPADAGMKDIPVKSSETTWTVAVQGDAGTWLEARRSGAVLRIIVKDNLNMGSRKGEIKVTAGNLGETVTVEQSGRNTGTPADVVTPDDIKVVPTGGTANQAQPGQGIANTYDGVFGGTPYHSPWGDGTTFPVILEYFFNNNPEQIDYLLYHTRNGNGNFGKLKLYVATQDNPEYKLYGDYDFMEKSSPSRIAFAGGLKKPVKIKFEVLSGYGGFASCDEMEFFRINADNSLNAQLLTVFTDITCSELKPGVTRQTVETLPAFFGQIALRMLEGTYESDFRIASYPAYSRNEEWAQKLMVNPRNDLDNPTGIYAEAGKEILVLVGNTHGNSISLRSIAETNYAGDDYFLQEGVNKITLRNRGLLYIMYNVSDLAAATSKPIKIHIPMGVGTVNGYWDIGEHKTNEKYRELLAKATYEYFDIKGTDIMLKFPTAKFRQHVPNEIIPAVGFWDKMVQTQQSIMGWGDIYPSKMNNRMYARSTKDGYMSAQSYQTNFAENILGRILSPMAMLSNEDNPWGPAHEIGHMNQGAINWAGITETSNNLFSNLIHHKMTSFPTRGQTIEENVKALLVENRVYTTVAYTDFGEVGYASLRMHWQLYCYFHWLENDVQFFPNLFKISREEGRRPIETNPGWSQLNFVRNACDAAKLDLTEFFEFWGFFRPANMDINEYYPAKLTVTQQMADQTVEYVKAKGYAKPKYPIQYIEDRDGSAYGDVGKINQFKGQKSITKNIDYTKNGNTITVRNGDEAVCFEVIDNNKVVFFSNKYTFNVPSNIWTETCRVYAMQSNGQRILLNAN